MKKKLCIVLAMVMLFTISTTSLAATEADEMYPSGKQETSVVTPKGMYIREVVGYDSTNHAIDECHTFLGMVSAENQTSETMTVEYTYTTSGSVETTLTTAVSTSEEVGLVLATVSVEAQVSLATTIAWQEGQESGATCTVSPGKKVYIRAYIPGVTIWGSIVTYVYMDPYKDEGWYEYKPISNIYIPVANYIHLVASES